MLSLRALIGWFIFIAVLAIVWRAFSMPDEAAIIAWLLSLLQTYGTWFVLGGSFLEGLFLVGLYFPGSLLIFLTVGTASSVVAAAWLVILISVGVLSAYLTNYVLGYYGWYRLLSWFGLGGMVDRAGAALHQNDWRYIFFTYWNPALAAITATACGVTKMSLPRFVVLSVGAIAFWNTLWGVVVYTLGQAALQLLSVTTVLGTLFGLIVGSLVWGVLRRRYTDADTSV